MHSRGEILAAIVAAAETTATAGESVQREASEPLAESEVPGINVRPESESLTGTDHSRNQTRQLLVACDCLGTSRTEADQIAAEVEESVPGSLAALHAELQQTDFAASGEGRNRLFITTVTFAVLYRTAAGRPERQT